MTIVTRGELNQLARRIASGLRFHVNRIDLRQYKSLFGCTPSICCIIWNKLNRRGVAGKAKPKHLLWYLLMLKVYPSESVTTALCQTTEKTFRKWFHFLLKKIPKISNVRMDCSNYVVQLLNLIMLFYSTV